LFYIFWSDCFSLKCNMYVLYELKGIVSDNDGEDDDYADNINEDDRIVMLMMMMMTMMLMER